MKRDENGRRLPAKAFVVEKAVSFVAAIQPIFEREQNTVLKTVNDVVQRCAVPHAHQSHRDDVSEIRCGVAILEPFSAERRENKAIVNMIAEPKR